MNTCSKKEETWSFVFKTVCVMLGLGYGLAVITFLNSPNMFSGKRELILTFAFIACIPWFSGALTRLYLIKLKMNVSNWFWLAPLAISGWTAFSCWLAFDYGLQADLLKQDISSIKEMVALRDASGAWFRIGFSSGMLTLFIPQALFLREAVAQIQNKGWGSLVR